MSNPSLVDYVIDRLADLGIEHVFGVPGSSGTATDVALESRRFLVVTEFSNPARVVLQQATRSNGD